jgi:Na+/H+-dicarboxylate symporter
MRTYLQKANTMSTTPDAPAEPQKEESGGHGYLTYFIIGAIFAAILAALGLPSVLGKETALTIFHTIETGGEVFLRALMMMVVPLVVASVMSGILGLGDVRKLGKPGFTAVAYYLSTTVLAVVVGLVWVNIIQPGKESQTQAESQSASVAEEEEGEEKSEEVIVTSRDKNLLLEELSSTVNLGKDLASTQADKASIFEASDTNSDGKLSGKEIKGWMKDADEPSTKDGKPDDEITKTEWDAETFKIPFVSPKKLAKLFPELKEGVPGEEPNIGTIMKNLVLMLFTDNLLKSASNTDLLPLIIFAIIFAGMLTTMGERVNSITSMIGQLNEAMMSFVMMLMNIAPIGIFCLVASKFGIAQAEGKFLAVISETAGFIFTVLAGLGTHAFITLPLIMWFFTRRNPYRYMKDMSRALLTAFSTASSSATLPVTMGAANDAGVSKRSTDFVLPLGATINMDGTALYEAAAAIFIANITPGFELTFGNQIIIAVTATLAAIGAAGIPEAGLVTMLIVLNAVGLPPDAIGSILAIDWLLDRFRTATNTFGDACGAAIVDKSFEGS